MAEQQRISFSLAEASFNDRKSRVAAALLKTSNGRRDLHLAQFVWMVFNMTHGGTDGLVVKTFEELASSPQYLWCSRSKAKSTVALAESRRLVIRVERRKNDGSQDANGYEIDWDGIHHTLGFSSLRKTAEFGSHPRPAVKELGSVASQPGSVLTETHIRNTPSCSSTLQTTGTGTDAQSRKRKLTDEEELELIERLPVLAEAWNHKVIRWPVGDLLTAPFIDRHDGELSNAGKMVIWFRRQLSLPVEPLLGRYGPVTGDTEAHLLLVLAAASHVQHINQEAITKGRWAIFASILTRRNWAKVLRRVDAAQHELAKLIEKYGRESLLVLPPTTQHHPGHVKGSHDGE